MKKSLFVVILILVLSLTFKVTVNASSDEGYGYDYYNQIVAAPSAYFVDEVITPKRLGLIENTEFRDVKIVGDRIYLLTKTNFYIYDLDYNQLFELGRFDSSDRDDDLMYDARGFAVTNEYLYIAEYSAKELREYYSPDLGRILYDDEVYLDPATKKYKTKDGDYPIDPESITTYAYQSRLLIFNLLDDNGELLNNEVTFNKLIRLRMDKNIPGVSEVGFHPQRVEVDNTGRIYVTAESVYQGIMELDFNGNFKKFVGTNKVKISAAEAFWKSLSPSTAGRKLYLPISFSSIASDPQGFVYATTSTTEVKPIQKFNYKGENVLIENGNTKVVGDVYEGQGISEFNDIAINDYGIYLALNVSQERPNVAGARNRIFAYNDNGELLYIIGNYQANDNHYLERPSVVRWHNNDILVVDNAALGNRILIYKETEYGQNINLATKHYYNGDFEGARPYWDKVMQANTNNDLAYIGIGKIYYQEGKYEEAIKYFKLGNNRIYYSKAYNKTRNNQLRVAMPYIFAGIIVLYAGLKGYAVWKRRQQKELD